MGPKSDDKDSQTKTSLPALRDRHPIVARSFDEAFRSLASVQEAVRTAGQDSLDALLTGLGKAKKVGRLLSTVRKGKKVTLVLSDEAKRRLKDGTWAFPIDKGTGLPRCDMRDERGRLKEYAGFKPEATATRAIRAAVALAHVVSAMDMQAQLEEMNRKLDRILGTIEAERRGELRGVYVGLQKALVDTDKEQREAALRRCSHELDKLQGRYFEAAKSALSSIRDPAAIGVFDAIFSLQSTATRKLKADLGAALIELRYLEFCQQLNALVHVELGEEDKFVLHRAALAASYQELRPLLVEKTGYLDTALAEATDAKLRLIEDSSRDAPAVSIATGEVLLSTDGGQG